MATKLTLATGIEVTENTAVLKKNANRLAAKNRGDLQSAIQSAGFYARKLGATMYGYAGNSYGSVIWRVSQKSRDYLDPINNTGSRVFSVTPDLVFSFHDVIRS